MNGIEKILDRFIVCATYMDSPQLQISPAEAKIMAGLLRELKQHRRLTMHPDSLNIEAKADEQDEKDKFAKELKEAIARNVINPPTDTYEKVQNAGEILRMVDALNEWGI